MKLGITGARGFIGRNLLSHLDSICVPYVVMERGECEIYLKSGITHVVHLAGRISSCKDLLLSEYLRDNVLLSSKILEFSNKLGVPILLFSTYGYHPSQVIPPSEYHLSKALLEDLAAYYALRSDLSIQVLRLASVYGPHQSQSSLLSNILDQVRGPCKSIVLRNTSALRSYVSVSDIIDFIMLSLEKKVGLQTHFVGSQTLFSVKAFAESVIKIVHCSKELECLPDNYRSDNELSIEMAIQQNVSMGNQHAWVPKRSLYQGLVETLQ